MSILRRSVLLFVLFGLTTLPDVRAQQATSWWPDPATGLMWTGYAVTGPKSTNAQATAACAALTLDGYSGWHLPTRNEFEKVTRTEQVQTYDTETIHTRYMPKQTVANLKSPDGTATDYHLKFLSSDANFWTSTVGRVPQDFWVMTYPYPPSSFNARSSVPAGVTRGLQALCARPMDADLLQLAKEANTPSPVPNLAALKAVPVLQQGEDAMANGQFQEAMGYIQQGMAMDPQFLRSLNDLGRVQSYLGQWDDAVSTFQRAGKIPMFTIKFTQKLQKQALSDANVTSAWDLVLKADTALSQKRYPDAADAATQVIKMEPKWFEGYRALGLADFNLSLWADAATAMKMASKLDFGTKTELADQLKTVEKNAKAAAKKAKA
jgi:hypothetical protein